LVVGTAVLSHWLLDFIVHRPDLQLYPGSEVRVDLGLWNSWAASIAIEVLLFGAGWGSYLSCTGARDNTGALRILGDDCILFFGWVSSLFAGAPPNVAALAWGGIAMGLTAPWGWWAGRHRVVIKVTQ